MSRAVRERQFMLPVLGVRTLPHPPIETPGFTR